MYMFMCGAGNIIGVTQHVTTTSVLLSAVTNARCMCGMRVYYVRLHIGPYCCFAFPAHSCKAIKIVKIILSARPLPFDCNEHELYHWTRSFLFCSHLLRWKAQLKWKKNIEFWFVVTWNSNACLFCSARVFSLHAIHFQPDTNMFKWTSFIMFFLLTCWGMASQRVL